MRARLISGIEVIQRYLVFALAVLLVVSIYSAALGRDYRSDIGSFAFFALFYGLLIAIKAILKGEQR